MQTCLCPVEIEKDNLIPTTLIGAIYSFKKVNFEIYIADRKATTCI